MQYVKLVIERFFCKHYAKIAVVMIPFLKIRSVCLSVPLSLWLYSRRWVYLGAMPCSDQRVFKRHRPIRKAKAPDRISIRQAHHGNERTGYVIYTSRLTINNAFGHL